MIDSRSAIVALVVCLLINGTSSLQLPSNPSTQVDPVTSPFFTQTNTNDNGQEPQSTVNCGYQSCPKTEPSKVNVHIIAHTHDDVGWLKTVDQYYYGTNKRYSPVGVQHILDSVVPQLLMDPTKRFIYVEMSFFVKWWQEQEEPMRRMVTQLVQRGQLEFINGGWCMNDEANVNYQSTIEQMTLGLKFLNETFGQCGRPKVGWQIDPFGHSNEQASLFAQFGFDGMFFTRISYLDKEARIANKSLDIVWHADRLLSGQSGSIFTNIFRDTYDSPPGFCFDVLCLDDNLVDNRKSYEYNIDWKGEQFISYIRTYASAKLTNNVLIPIGGDFHYSAAGQNFKNIDKLIKFVRARATDLNIFYSTPSCYQLAVHDSIQASGIRLPEKYDDFMPYDSSPTVWWSGYFASRPSVKLVERETANLLQVTRLVSLANLIKSQAPAMRISGQVGGNSSHSHRQATLNLMKSSLMSWADEVRDHENRCLYPLWEVLGDMQHHDAVTGTEKQHVTDDYLRRASDAAALCAKFIGDLRRSKLHESLKKSHLYHQLSLPDSPNLHNNSERTLIANSIEHEPIYLEETQFCPLLNISQCEPVESEINMKIYLKKLTKSSGTNNNRHKRGLNSPARSSSNLPSELATKAVMVNVYNPLARAISQHDIRLPCNGRCDLEKVKVISLSTNETVRLIRLPLPSGVATLPFRDATSNYELLFYANLPPLGYTSFVLEDMNDEETVDEEEEASDSIVVNDDATTNGLRSGARSHRLKRRQAGASAGSERGGFDYFELTEFTPGDELKASSRARRSEQSGVAQHHSPADRVIVKFDLSTGMIVGLRRARDGSFLNVTQRFGYYFPANQEAPPGAYIFRPNSTEPQLLDRPIRYKMFKRKSGALIEIHQKWADWLWQTIRVDATKNYIEFDYVVGPIPVDWWKRTGREVVTRYITNMANNGVFMTDSNGRQLLTRQRVKSSVPEQLGGSFYPVVSTILLRNTGNLPRVGNRSSAETVAVLVDRAQAGASLNEGQLELLIHRRHLRDDNFGVGEPLNEPGEDGRGLVTRGRHRLYLKFQDQEASPVASHQAADAHHQVSNRSPVAPPVVKRAARPHLIKLPESPRANLSYEEEFYLHKDNYYIEQQRIWKPSAQSQPRPRPTNLFAAPTYVAHDQVYNDLKQESVKLALRPILTFDRLRLPASDFVNMIAQDPSVAQVERDLSLLNSSLPSNVHLLTLQPWASSFQAPGESLGSANELLIRLENLDNPLTLHPYPDPQGYQALVRSYRATGDYYELDAADQCAEKLRPRVEVDIEYLIKKIRIVSLEELNLGANARLKDDKRLDWTDENYDQQVCEFSDKPTVIKLAPRQIRTFSAKFDFI